MLLDRRSKVSLYKQIHFVKSFNEANMDGIELWGSD